MKTGRDVVSGRSPEMIAYPDKLRLNSELVARQKPENRGNHRVMICGMIFAKHIFWCTDPSVRVSHSPS